MWFLHNGQTVAKASTTEEPDAGKLHVRVWAGGRPVTDVPTARGPLNNMKNPDRKTVSDLKSLPNIGKSIANDLQIIGIEHPQQLIGKNPFDLYEELCNTTARKHDPCVIDVFMSAVDFMEGGNPKAWWEFTLERKKILKLE